MISGSTYSNQLTSYEFSMQSGTGYMFIGQSIEHFWPPIMATAYQFCARQEVHINFSPYAEPSLIPGANADPRCRLTVDLLPFSVIGFPFLLFIMEKIG